MCPQKFHKCNFSRFSNLVRTKSAFVCVDSGCCLGVPEILRAIWRTWFTCKGTLLQVFICLRPSPLLHYCLEWSTNFVGSESGQIQSVKLLQKMVSNRKQHPPATHCLYVLYFDTEKGLREGRRWTREKVRGAIVQKVGSKIPTWLTVSPASKI